MDTKALFETLKSVLRGIYFAGLGVVALILTVIATSPEIAHAIVLLPWLGEVNVGVLIVGGVASVAKAIDRYRHKSENTDSNGIAPGFLQR